MTARTTRDNPMPSPRAWDGSAAGQVLVGIHGDKYPAGVQRPLRASSGRRDTGAQIVRDDDDGVAAVGARPGVELEPDRAEHAPTASQNQER